MTSFWAYSSMDCYETWSQLSVMEMSACLLHQMRRPSDGTHTKGTAGMTTGSRKTDMASHLFLEHWNLKHLTTESEWAKMSANAVKVISLLTEDNQAPADMLMSKTQSEWLPSKIMCLAFCIEFLWCYCLVQFHGIYNMLWLLRHFHQLIVTLDVDMIHQVRCSR